jgi:hypothetical protein
MWWTSGTARLATGELEVLKRKVKFNLDITTLKGWEWYGEPTREWAWGRSFSRFDSGAWYAKLRILGVELQVYRHRTPETPIKN